MNPNEITFKVSGVRGEYVGASAELTIHPNGTFIPVAKLDGERVVALFPKGCRVRSNVIHYGGGRVGAVIVCDTKAGSAAGVERMRKFVARAREVGFGVEIDVTPRRMLEKAEDWTPEKRAVAVEMAEAGEAFVAEIIGSAV